MENMLLLLFGLLCSMGSFLILADVLQIPKLKAKKAILNLGKMKKKAKNKDAFILDIAVKLAKFIKLDTYKKRKWSSLLKSAEISFTPEVYLAQVYVKTMLTGVLAIPFLFIFPIISPVFLALSIGVYFSELSIAEKKIKKKREEIEYELPRLVAFLTQSLKATRDVKTLLETY